MMARTAEVYSQIFIYILTIVVIAVILVYGYKSISNFKDRAEQISCIKFRNDVKNSVESLSGDFGTIKIKQFQMCPGYTQVCFTETHEQIGSIPPNSDPIIIDSIQSGTGKNVFLIKKLAEESFYIGNISVEPDIMCITPSNDDIRLRMESRGDYIFISRP